jgi:DNA excision repair protein ERCC-3
MHYVPDNPLIVQSDQTLLLETMGPHFKACRDALCSFAELVKSPEYVHTYRITPLSLWNAAAAGVGVEDVLETLSHFAKYDVPPNVPVNVTEIMGRYGRLKLLAVGDRLHLIADVPILMVECRNLKAVRPLLAEYIDDVTTAVDPGRRGELKQALTRAGHPVEDLAGYVDGEALELQVRRETLTGQPFGFREYQTQAIDGFLGDGTTRGGSGVIVLPCGAGKTIVGIGAIARLGMKTLILCTNVTALRQWRTELLDKTSLTDDDIGEYSGESKQIRPITLSTYQILTWRRSRADEFVHFSLFNKANWGLVIYDEVHLLPAPIFRTVAMLQARRRLGLTATLVREDGKEGDVFALIGPKRFDMPWKDLEHQGWIAKASCQEIRIGLSSEDRIRYAVADDREKFRIASTNSRKGPVVQELLQKHRNDKVLVLGMYLDQLRWLARRWKLPLITGQTPQSKRDELYDAFRRGEHRAMVVSKVGNFSVDLPDASVAIQVSGTWGSRQEEAQRLGRILRPKKGDNSAHFYSVVTRDSEEQRFAERRQLFLTEQGYAYTIDMRD